MIQMYKVPVCGASEALQPSLRIICTEKPGHEGDHRTIYSVESERKTGFEYRWPQNG